MQHQPLGWLSKWILYFYLGIELTPILKNENLTRAFPHLLEHNKKKDTPYLREGPMKTIVNSLLISLPTLFLFSQSFAAEVGFKNGNNFEITPIHGTVTAQCSDPGYGSRFYSCDDEMASPGYRDVLVANIDADSVTLTATHESGKQHTKVVNFDSTKKESKKINLLISTLFQTPLLDYGKNNVQYSFTSNNKEVLAGQFESNVKILKGIECPWITIFENGIGCDQTTVCRDYFNTVRNCK